MSATNETIVALATPPGRGGVGIIRLSGPDALSIGQTITHHSLAPRLATYLTFYSSEQQTLDQGIAIYFKAPHSFTGEDVVELQGHGGPVVLDILIKEVVKLGARLARPGEFSERAFLNDKMDLAQAEAISDLINASSEQAVKSALRSLQGEFSDLVHGLVEELIHLRLYVEAAIDFPEEEIDFLSDGKVQKDLQELQQSIIALEKKAQQGAILRDGMNVVLAGKPNAGKSSLMNALAGKDSAIVTDIPGTTRDILKEHIHIDGMPLHIIDTAGLRDASDKVEQIGIERAWKEISEADRVLLVTDSSEPDHEQQQEQVLESLRQVISQLPPVTVIKNKADIAGLTPQQSEQKYLQIQLSAKSGEGVELLKEHLKQCMGYQSSNEGVFMARRRHIEAIAMAKHHVKQAMEQLVEFNAGELVAEELRLAQNFLSEITGEFTADDLLGRIFSSFCIGK
ncbi:tRNA uridine-5-carboxymethylaminomethyl(34) synthesis GTPase MnmE [Pleionea sp. CnH1-48]|uniref:tRNA uridine-5-carboxymethylaminomethyl(34) synthesis GTPase MnmE n=1 Tax=Pleionea sp. CnH1-48 TaxID=2954494 RepID=UPI002097B746|nr:tRNA uridine-5-carboxymethylaminomethyl(34) synthesis GTPase MnmE [Pleionea sp. CnH1-48]MCO7226617.1 tRNA uridine-5-carboxymethylaminomethyl(34) synthesis GTPase MnmE [Pleionea sp. CnH1-48]